MKLNERGEGKLGLIVLLIVLAAIVFVLVKAVPPRVNAYELNDFIEQYGRQDSWRKTPEQMRRDILSKAKDLKLPLTAKDIKINRRGASLEIQVIFDVPVDLKVYTWVMHFDFKNHAEHF